MLYNYEEAINGRPKDNICHNNTNSYQCNHKCKLVNNITYSECENECTNSHSCVAFLPEHDESSSDPGFCYIYNTMLNSTDYTSQGNYILYKKIINT